MTERRGIFSAGDIHLDLLWVRDLLGLYPEDVTLEIAVYEEEKSNLQNVIDNLMYKIFELKYLG